ncbi:Ig-like domain-containing protein [Leucobacter luti]|uniref:Ig-like domain-containing protein n=1 Tax=Leucobacter luti TaxID=340320 RepID=A0A4Q7TM76_9MICO|nr:Ig-like domain-containing protein [Leucobacter luti]MBL3700190.1 Ig-like domain repeat protein [Leucobacter luti]RZT61087.1 Ig-like domain-containing protein [Leucobacter luti]
MNAQHAQDPDHTAGGHSPRRPRKTARVIGASIVAVGLVGGLSWAGISASIAAGGLTDRAYLGMSIKGAEPRSITVSGRIDGVHGTIPTGTVSLRCGTVELGTVQLAAGLYTFTFEEHAEWTAGEIECTVSYAGDKNHLPSEKKQLVDLAY